MSSGFVYVLPLEKRKSGKKRSQRGVFLLIFDQGALISRDTSLIVFWDERGKGVGESDRSQVDYILPSEHQRQIKEAIEQKKLDRKALSKKLESELTKGSTKITKEKIQLMAELTTVIGFNDLEVMMLNSHKGKKSTVNNFSIFDIEMALENGGGRWRKFSKNAYDPGLRKKYLTKPPKSFGSCRPSRKYQQWVAYHKQMFLWGLLREGKSFELESLRLIERDIMPLSMELMRHSHFRIKRPTGSSLNDPVSIVRSFLRFIGVYLETRGSSSSTSKVREQSPLYRVVLDNLKRYMSVNNVTSEKIPRTVIVKAFRKSYPNLPTVNQIQMIRETLSAQD